MPAVNIYLDEKTYRAVLANEGDLKSLVEVGPDIFGYPEKKYNTVGTSTIFRYLIRRGLAGYFADSGMKPKGVF